MPATGAQDKLRSVSGLPVTATVWPGNWRGRQLPGKAGLGEGANCLGDVNWRFPQANPS